MTVFDFVALAGGVALLIYGMSIMGSGLEKLAGGKMESVLQRLTSSTVKGVGLGALFTGLIQSSAATTVICIGLVNSGIMQFRQAVGVIMGANIGTTVTGQLISLADISGDNILLQILKPSTLAPAVAFAGMVLYMFFKSQQKRNIGQIFLGFGIMFSGIFAMEAAVFPLRESPVFLELFSTLTNPILGIIAGAVFTAAIQSSSASVGVLQALTVTGAITWGNAVPIIFGQNIGTCVTAFLASVGASRSAKRVAVTHLVFNLSGTVVFAVIIYAIKGIFGIPFWDDPVNKSDIAMFHTFFNVIVTLAYIPFVNLLVWIAEKIIPEKAGEAHPELEATILDERLLTSPPVAIAQARKAVEQMAVLGHMNQQNAVHLLVKYDPEGVKLAEQREDLVDKLDVSVTNYLVALAEKDLSEADSREVTTLLNFVTEFERMADYAMNVVERAGEVLDKEITFSPAAQHEMNVLSAAVDSIYYMATEAFVHNDVDVARRVEPLEETVDTICETLRDGHISRLKAGRCSLEAGIVFLEVLTDYERISDHCSNVAARLLSNEADVADSHALRRSLHGGQEEWYNRLTAEYAEKYLAKLSSDYSDDENAEEDAPGTKQLSFGE